LVDRRLTVRQAEQEDLPFLTAMSDHAAYWRPGSQPPAVPEPGHARYLEGWGRPGDAGVVAELDGTAAGAAWYRLFDPLLRGYGFVAANIPELTIAVRSDVRDQGIGRALLSALIEVARREGRPALSLSVELENSRAVGLYVSCGFQPVSSDRGAMTMLLDL
jgi:ribosomal protein S18 acetylase RimI-like enzyme